MVDHLLRQMLQRPAGPHGIVLHLRHPLGGFAWLLLTALAWGFNWPVMKALMREWPPFSFRIIAGSGAILLLFAIALASAELLVLPASGATPRLRRWPRDERAMLFVHAAVFSLATAALLPQHSLMASRKALAV